MLSHGKLNIKCVSAGLFTKLSAYFYTLNVELELRSFHMEAKNLCVKNIFQTHRCLTQLFTLTV